MIREEEEFSHTILQRCSFWLHPISVISKERQDNLICKKSAKLRYPGNQFRRSKGHEGLEKRKKNFPTQFHSFVLSGDIR